MLATLIEVCVGREIVILLLIATDLLATTEVTVMLESLATLWSNDESHVSRLPTFRRGCIMTA